MKVSFGKVHRLPQANLMLAKAPGAHVHEGLLALNYLGIAFMKYGTFIYLHPSYYNKHPSMGKESILLQFPVST